MSVPVLCHKPAKYPVERGRMKGGGMKGGGMKGEGWRVKGEVKTHTHLCSSIVLSC